jgi:hypothetical protein
MLGLGQLGIGGDPAQMKQRGLSLADLLGHGAISDRLPRLPFERVHLSGKLIDDVFEPRQILLRPAQPQFGLVPPHVQARYAGSFLEHAPALSGFAWMISPMRPWCTIDGEREPVEASANRICTSRARTSRPLMR